MFESDVASEVSGNATEFYDLVVRGGDSLVLSLGGAIVDSGSYAERMHSQVRIWFPNSFKNYCFLASVDGAALNIIGDDLSGFPLSYRVVDRGGGSFYLRQPSNQNYLTFEDDSGVVVAHHKHLTPIAFQRINPRPMSAIEAEQFGNLLDLDLSVGGFTSEQMVRRVLSEFAEADPAGAASYLRLIPSSVVIRCKTSRLLTAEPPSLFRSAVSRG